MQITNTIKQIVKLQWTVADGDWVYMDTWEFIEEEFAALTEEQILARQTAQYTAWKMYCTEKVE